LSRIVGRIAPELPQPAGTTYSITEDRVEGVSIRNLFTDGRAPHDDLLLGRRLLLLARLDHVVGMDGSGLA
jgi:hypothetical protein